MAATRIIDAYKDLYDKPLLKTIYYKPGDTSNSFNIATTWDQVETFITENQGKVNVFVDDSLAPCVVPSTADTNCYGFTVFSGLNAILTIEDGGRLRNIRGINEVLTIQSAPTTISPIVYDLNNTVVIMREGGTLRLKAGATVPLVSIETASIIFISYLSGLYDNSEQSDIPLFYVNGSNTIILGIISNTNGGTLSPTLVGGDPGAVLLYAGDSTFQYTTQTIFPGTVIPVRASRSDSLLWSYGDTLSRPTNAVVGQQYFDTSQNKNVTWNGSAWGSDFQYGTETIIYRPGEPSADNHVQTWPEIESFISGNNGYCTVIVDGQGSPCYVPSSSMTNCYGRTIFSPYSFNIGSLEQLIVQDGGKILNPYQFSGPISVTGECLTTNALEQNVPGSVTLFQNGGKLTQLTGSTVPALLVNANFCEIAVGQGAIIDNSAISSQPVIEMTPGNTMIFASVSSFAGNSFDQPNLILGDNSNTIIYISDLTSPARPQNQFTGLLVDQKVSYEAGLIPNYGDTAARPASPATGYKYFDTDEDSLIVWNGSGWVSGSSGNATAIQSIPVDSSPPTIEYSVPVWVSASNTYVPMPLTLDMIGPAFAISVSGGTTVEIGATITSQSLSISYTGTPVAPVTLTDSEGSPTTPLISPFTSVVSPLSTTKTTNNATVTYTIHANGKTGSASTAFRPRVYFGSAIPGAHDEAFIEALASSALASSRNRTISVSATAGQRAYYAIPSSYGTPTFTIGGFVTTHTLIAAAVPVTNVNGVTQNYDLWASDIFGGSTSYSNVVT